MKWLVMLLSSIAESILNVLLSSSDNGIIKQGWSSFIDIDLVEFILSELCGSFIDFYI